jgi:hypothetical protein
MRIITADNRSAMASERCPGVRKSGADNVSLRPGVALESGEGFGS